MNAAWMPFKCSPVKPLPHSPNVTQGSWTCPRANNSIRGPCGYNESMIVRNSSGFCEWTVLFSMDTTLSICAFRSGVHVPRTQISERMMFRRHSDATARTSESSTGSTVARGCVTFTSSKGAPPALNATTMPLVLPP